MADKMALNMGKRLLRKKIEDESNKDSGDAYKYLDKNGRKHKKNLKYFEQTLGIPPQDAAILLAVMKRARTIDGVQFGPFRFGVGTIVGFFPAIGDAVDGLLAMTVVKQASKVSGGLDKGIREKMIMNVIIDVLIGITPVLGDFADCVYQANTKNARLLEKMLTKRVAKELDAAIIAEKERHAAPVRNYSQVDGASSTSSLSSNYDARHAGMHKRLQGQEIPQRTGTTQTSENNKPGWMNKFATGGGNEVRANDVASARPSRPNANIAPEQPPRPRYQPVGSF